MNRRRSKLNPISMTRIDGVANKKCWKETKTTKYIKEIKEAEINDKFKCNGVEI